MSKSERSPRLLHHCRLLLVRVGVTEDLGKKGFKGAGHGLLELDIVRQVFGTWPGGLARSTQILEDEAQLLNV